MWSYGYNVLGIQESVQIKHGNGLLMFEIFQFHCIGKL